MSNTYPDSPPATLGDLKSIKRHPRMCVVAPTIKWGDDYRSWPMAKQLRYAERLAATMNHAADILQQERNAQNKLLQEKEALIIQLAAAGENTDAVLQHQLSRGNAERQALMARVVELQAENKRLAIELDFLKADADVAAS